MTTDPHALVFGPPTAEELAPSAPVDEWLARRLHGFGASELAALLVALGRRPADGLPKYVQDDARLLFARKRSGRQKKAGAAARGGQARERDVLDAWVRAGCPGSDVTPSTVRHADEVPREWLPLVDRYEPRMLATPDAWGRTSWGGLVAVEIKTTWDTHYPRPWSHAVQVQGEVAVMGADEGIVVCGPGWANPRVVDGELMTWPIERDDALIAELRAACAEGWLKVKGGA